MNKPLLIRHLDSERSDRFPVWMMRQAGRYLPEYQRIRKEHSFWEMVCVPEIAAKVSLLPVQRFEMLSAVIFFSDILTMPHSLGIPIELVEGVGPVNHTPFGSELDFKVFDAYEPARETRYVGAALRQIRQTLDRDKALLGFAGAPWTVGCYLIEGQPAKTFRKTLTSMHSDPTGLVSSLNLLADATNRYLKYQIENGADAVQLFDTWLSQMPRAFFERYYLDVLEKTLHGIDVPKIFFAHRAHHLLDLLTQLDVEVLSVDSLATLTHVDKITGGKFHLQGNLDPAVLFSDPATVRRKTRELVADARSLARPAILNLGHGVLPSTPLDSVAAFLEEASAVLV